MEDVFILITNRFLWFAIGIFVGFKWPKSIDTKSGDKGPYIPRDPVAAYATGYRDDSAQYFRDTAAERAKARQEGFEAGKLSRTHETIERGDDYLDGYNDGKLTMDRVWSDRIAQAGKTRIAKRGNDPDDYVTIVEYPLATNEEIRLLIDLYHAVGPSLTCGSDPDRYFITPEKFEGIFNARNAIVNRPPSWTIAQKETGATRAGP